MLVPILSLSIRYKILNLWFAAHRQMVHDGVISWHLLNKDGKRFTTCDMAYTLVVRISIQLKKWSLGGV